MIVGIRTPAFALDYETPMDYEKYIKPSVHIADVSSGHDILSTSPTTSLIKIDARRSS